MYIIFRTIVKSVLNSVQAFAQEGFTIPKNVAGGIILLGSVIHTTGAAKFDAGLKRGNQSEARNNHHIESLHYTWDQCYQ